MKRRPSHILVIRLSAMGDVAMTVPVLQQLLHTYPKLKITVLTKPFFAHLFAHLDRVEVIKAEVNTRHKGISGLWLLAKELHRLNFDSIADLHHVLRSRILCGFLKILGHDYFRIDKGRTQKKALTRPKNKVFKPLKTTHQRYADVFQALNLPLKKGFIIERKPLALSESLQSELNPKHTWIGIAPFAAHTPKQYPLELMSEVLYLLDNNKNVLVLLFGGGPQETDQLKRLAEPYEHVCNIASRFSFPEELQLISNLDVMVSMDSGNGHLAAMFGVDVITLWGATHPYAGFAPYGQTKDQQLLPNRVKYPLLPTSIYGNKIVSSYENVMYDITPNQVYNKLNPYINLKSC